MAANKITIGLGVVIQMQLMDIRDILQEAANRNGFLAQAIEEEDEDFDIEEGSSRGGFGFPGAEIPPGSEEERELYARVLGVMCVHDGMQFVRYLPAFMAAMVESSSSEEESEREETGRPDSGAIVTASGSPEMML